jgi:hypothetical protein
VTVCLTRFRRDRSMSELPKEPSHRIQGPNGHAIESYSKASARPLDDDPGRDLARAPGFEPGRGGLLDGQLVGRCPRRKRIEPFVRVRHAVPRGVLLLRSHGVEEVLAFPPFDSRFGERVEGRALFRRRALRRPSGPFGCVRQLDHQGGRARPMRPVASTSRRPAPRPVPFPAASRPHGLPPGEASESDCSGLIRRPTSPTLCRRRPLAGTPARVTSVL